MSSSEQSDSPSYVVDASVWVSRFIQQDTNHAASAEWLMEQADSGSLLVCPSITLAEVACAISRRLDESSYGKRCAELLLRIPNLHCVAVDPDLAVLSYRIGADLRLRGADAVYVALAKRLGIPLVSWDNDQIGRSSTIIDSLRPSPAA